MKKYLEEIIIPSFYGADGGNINYPIWICGLEHGGSFEDNKEELEISIRNNLSYKTPFSWEDEEYQDAIYAPGNLNRYLSAFYGQYEDILPKGENFNNYALDNAFVSTHKMLYRDGIGFKMNLFPLRFKSVESRDFEAIESSFNIEQYEQLVLERRGQFYLKKIKEHNPKAIICLGISQLHYFQKFFKIDTFQEAYFELENKSIPYHKASLENGTDIIVIPFIGRPSGPNGYLEIYQFADLIRENYPQ